MMNIRTGVIKSHADKLDKLVKMGDEELNKKLNWHDKYDEMIMIGLIICAISLSLTVDIFVYNNLSDFYPLTLWIYLFSAVLFIGTVFCVSSGYTHKINQLVIIPNEEKYQYKVRYLTQSSKEVALYVQEAKDLNRTLRVFDLDVMQCISDTENWIKNRQYKKMLNENNQVKSLKTIVLER